MKRKHKNKAGLSLVEVMLALVILATLMAAVAIAFDASIKNYKDNEAIAEILNIARAALFRITNDVRTAAGVAVIGAGGDPDNSQCGIDLDGDLAVDVCYRFSSAENKLYLDEISSGSSYVLCENVTAMTFDRGSVPGNPDLIRNVRINMTITDEQGDITQNLVTAAVVRRNL